jgi:hypothetical protein
MLAACSSDGGGTTPTPQSPTGMNLAGTWTGTMAESTVDPDPDRLSWTATQSGASVSGTAVLTMMGDTPKVVTGTMTGVVAGTQVSLTFTLPAGSFVSVGGPAGCSVTGTATSTPTDTSIAAAMTRTFSAACIGIVGKSSTDMVQLSLSK